MLKPLFLALMLMLSPALASAHSSSSSYLNVSATGAALDVRWSIALRDLDYAIGIDADGSGAITWGMVRAKAAEIDALALSRLALLADGAACTPGPVHHAADRLSDGGYVVLNFTATCPAAPRELTVRYALLFDQDPQHRGLLHLTLAGEAHTTAFSPAQSEQRFDARGSILAAIREFFESGVRHLLTGPDHLLFVTMLVVPAFLGRDGRGTTLRKSLLNTATLLSAFTVAHSITLTLAVLHYIALPTRVIESGVALTILLTALDNIHHFLPGPRVLIAAGFGMIHGLGFAETLDPLQLPAGTLATALLSFNLGLEVAQLAFAALVLPPCLLLRGMERDRAAFAPGLSAATALVALAWFTDRAGDFGLMPF